MSRHILWKRKKRMVVETRVKEKRKRQANTITKTAILVKRGIVKLRIKSTVTLRKVAEINLR